ncbi:hypothetical protein G6M04_23765 [Agrobacterium rhizogenes]|uniref:hypothetical protein n=1 Tax=Rhizobium rhizogenes TaxID=359 RepID=UPI001572BF55|nr:hypothetical protein [Rhizobium rhizogenes]NTG50410.1 hypothetical protein [Rhizobium rhizogenes]
MRDDLLGTAAIKVGGRLGKGVRGDVRFVIHVAGLALALAAPPMGGAAVDLTLRHSSKIEMAADRAAATAYRGRIN